METMYYQIVLKNGKPAKGFCPTVFDSKEEAILSAPSYYLKLLKLFPKQKYNLSVCCGSSSGIDIKNPIIFL